MDTSLLCNGHAGVTDEMRGDEEGQTALHRVNHSGGFTSTQATTWPLLPSSWSKVQVVVASVLAVYEDNETEDSDIDRTGGNRIVVK